MIVIGERINGMFKKVKQAVADKDKGVIQDIARQQVEAGASILDINVGPASADPVGTMEWLVEATQDAVDVPLSIDSAKYEAVEAGLKVRTGKSVINSTTGHQESLDKYFELAKAHNAAIIALTIDERGVPGDVDGRVEIAMRALEAALVHDIALDDLYIDPIILPVNVAQPQAGNVLEAASQFKFLSDPPPHIVIGLSNVSQKAVNKHLIDRTFLVMCIAAGLDSAIMDPLDSDLMDAMITAELLMNKNIYCDSFLDAYRR